MRTVALHRTAFDPREVITPDKDRILSDDEATCGHCMRRFPKADLVIEDGVEICRQGSSPTTTEDYKAALQEEIAAKHESYIPRPIESQARHGWPEEAVITSMEDADGNAVAVNAPLNMVRTVAKQLIVNGRDFSASDTFAYSSGISDSVAPVRTGTTLWTLTLVASGGMTPGDKYDLTFNTDTTLRNVFSVRA